MRRELHWCYLDVLGLLDAKRIDIQEVVHELCTPKQYDIWLNWIAGYSAANIASAAGCSPSYVYYALHEIRRKLRKYSYPLRFDLI